MDVIEDIRQQFISTIYELELRKLENTNLYPAWQVRKDNKRRGFLGRRLAASLGGAETKRVEARAKKRALADFNSRRG